MNKIYSILTIALLSSSVVLGQSNPQVDRPVKQCVTDNQESLESLPENFSISFWLGGLIESCAKLQKTKGKGGGPIMIAILDKEAELDDLIALSETCGALGEESIQTNLKEMKTFYQEKVEETYERKDGGSNLFGEKSTLTTRSIPRSAAKEIGKRAANIKKALLKKYN